MFTAFHGTTMNDLTLNVYQHLISNGRHQPSRNGDIKCVNNAILNLANPRSRHLSLEGRNSNIIAQIAETFWVMAGLDEIDPYLSFFLPRAKDYSDDGITWRGAYGPRLYMYDQYQDAVNAFIEGGWESRQSVIQILLPEMDSKQAILERDTGDENGNTKDRPCFSGDTEVFTMSGYKRIDKIATGDYVLSYNKETECMEPKLVTWSGKTKDDAEVYDITLSDDSVVTVTPDHIVYIKEYTYTGRSRQPYTVKEKKVSELVEGDYILGVPINDKSMRYKRHLRDNTNFHNMKSCHIAMGEIVNGGPIPEGYDVHHIDHDHNNNELRNLSIITRKEHNSYHKTVDNPSKSIQTSNRRKKLSKLYPGITNGNYHKGKTKQDIIQEYVNAVRDESLVSLAYDDVNGYSTEIGLPPLTMCIRLFGSWKLFKQELFGVIGDEYPDLFETRRNNISNKQKSFLKIKKINKHVSKQSVYDLTVEDNHNFVLKSGGWIVHNCNNELVFYMTPNSDGSYALNMNVFQRSGDAIWGALNINVFEWTFMQELMANTLNLKMKEKIVLGEYTHFVTNLHVYDSTSKQAIDAVKNSKYIPNKDTLLHNECTLVATNDVAGDKYFFTHLVDLYTRIIKVEAIPHEWDTTGEYVEYWLDQLQKLFRHHNVEMCLENLIWVYANSVMFYILDKKFEIGKINDKQLQYEWTLNYSVGDVHESIAKCLKNSKFYKMPVEEI